MKITAPRRLLLEDQWRPADSLSYEVDVNFNAVGNFDEGNSAVHPVIFPVKGHHPFNCACTGSLTGYGEGQRFRLRHPTDCKCALNVNAAVAGLRDLRGMKRDVGVMVSIEEILALQLSVLHPASRIHAACLNFDIQNA